MNGMIAGLAQGQSVLINANKTSRPGGGKSAMNKRMGSGDGWPQ